MRFLKGRIEIARENVLCNSIDLGKYQTKVYAERTEVLQKLRFGHSIASSRFYRLHSRKGKREEKKKQEEKRKSRCARKLLFGFANFSPLFSLSLSLSLSLFFLSSFLLNIRRKDKIARETSGKLQNAYGTPLIFSTWPYVHRELEPDLEGQDECPSLGLS